MACGTNNPVENGICYTCMSKINKVPEPVCEICGYPIGTPGTCIKCLKENPPYDKLTAAYIYEGVIKDIIMSFKYSSKTIFKKYLGKVIHDIVIKEHLEPDIITFIPMHYTRLFIRGYNHSALIAKESAKLLGTNVDFSILKKTSGTKPQATLRGHERRKNVKGSFIADNVSKAKVLVVDDVVTTGETARAAALALKTAGAEKVYFAGIGRAMPWLR